MMNSHDDTRVRTTHAGSLPRSENLAGLMAAYMQNELSEEELQSVLPVEVQTLVGKQVEAGVNIVSDGEAGKAGYNSYVLTRLEGLGGETEAWHVNDMLEVPELHHELSSQLDELSKKFKAVGRMPGCVDKLRYVGQASVQRDIENFKAAMATHGVSEAFMPAASPGTLATQIHNYYYNSYESYLEAISEAMSEEYRAIVKAGFVLQLDCPDIPMSGPGHRRYWATDLVERIGHQRLIEMHVEALNQATSDLPADRIRMHLCWGNYEGPHHYDAPLEEVLSPVLRRARVGGISFESANPRHGHEWEVFGAISVPEDMILIPGVIDSTTNFVEHPRLVAQRIERFMDIVGPARVIGGTDCGFASSAGRPMVHSTVAWMKLRALSEGAAIASKRKC